MARQPHEQEPPIEIPPAQVQPELDASSGEGFVGEEGRAKAIEQAPSSGGSQLVPDDQNNNGQSAQPQNQQQQSDDVAQAGRSLPAGWMPQIANDTDLIEKEWIDKAKEIVASTAHDPYLQNKEINKIRVDYLKKRYNKEIKQSEP